MSPDQADQMISVLSSISTNLSYVWGILLNTVAPLLLANFAGVLILIFLLAFQSVKGTA